MATDLFEDEGFPPDPPGSEPPEGDVELALQEEALGSDALAPDEPAPPVAGRSWKLNLDAGRLVPEGGPPAAIYGADAMRQAIEKTLRTDRGSAPVQGEDYGLEDAEREAEGQPFDGAAFAELEERVRDALLVLPWVLDVQEFDAEGGPSTTTALVTFRVVPEGDAEPIDFDRYPLPIP
jgi:hypothetical protein